MIDINKFNKIRELYTHFVFHPLTDPTKKGDGAGKRPVLQKWQTLKTTPIDIDTYIKNGSNIGIVCGQVSDVLVLDFDHFLFIEDVFNGCESIQTLRGKRTDGRGHVYFKYTNEIHASKHHTLGIEIMTDGGQVVIAPSIHMSGDEYVLNEFPIIEMPARVISNVNDLFKTETELKQMIGRTRACFRKILTDKPDLHGAEGREFMLALCTDLKSACATEKHIMMLARLIYGAGFDGDRTRKEWQNIDASKTWTCETLKQRVSCFIDPAMCDDCDKRRENYKTHPDEPTLRSAYLVTDLANAERFVKKYKGDVLFIPEWQKWLVWGGKVWEHKHDEAMHGMAHRVVMDMYAQIATITDDEKRTCFSKNVPKCESVGRIGGMIEEAKPYLLEKPENFDTNQMNFVVDNGVLNLNTMQLEPHDKYRRVMQRSHVVYKPDEKCPLFDATLLKAFRGNLETIRFFQKACGYSMTGSTKEQCFFIQWGAGANLKSTTQEVISHIMGDYHKGTDVKTFQGHDKNIRGASPELAVLAGSRYVRCGENEEQFRLNEGLIKQITGSADGKLSCRKLYEQDSSFMVEFKIWVSTNHKPEIKGTDYGIWRRVKLIPFSYTIPESERIQDYHKTIIDTEASGVLNWMLEGVKMWKAEGVGTCPEVDDATNIFRAENDTIQQFINEYCDVGKNKDVVGQELYNVYVRDFCASLGDYPLNRGNFHEKLVEKGFVRTKRRKGVVYIGLELKDESQNTLAEENSMPAAPRVTTVTTVTTETQSTLENITSRGVLDLVVTPVTTVTLQPPPHGNPRITRMTENNINNNNNNISHDSMVPENQGGVKFEAEGIHKFFESKYSHVNKPRDDVEKTALMAEVISGLRDEVKVTYPRAAQLWADYCTSREW